MTAVLSASSPKGDQYRSLLTSEQVTSHPGLSGLVFLSSGRNRTLPHPHRLLWILRGNPTSHGSSHRKPSGHFVDVAALSNYCRYSAYHARKAVFACLRLSRSHESS